MSKFPWKINGEDFTGLVNKYGYTTDRIPVYSSVWTDLSGVEHSTKLRDKGYLAVTLNDITAEESLRLCRQLRRPSLQVEYHSFQLGQVVPERMRVTSMPRSLLMMDGKTPIHGSVTLEFEQL